MFPRVLKEIIMVEGDVLKISNKNAIGKASGDSRIDPILKMLISYFFWHNPVFAAIFGRDAGYPGLTYLRRNNANKIVVIPA